MANEALSERKSARTHSDFTSEFSVRPRNYQLSNRIKNRVAPPETAPNVAPFLPPTAAPIAVAMPAVAAIIKASFSQDRRFPPPHNIIAAFIYTSWTKFSLLLKQAAFQENGSDLCHRP